MSRMSVKQEIRYLGRFSSGELESHSNLLAVISAIEYWLIRENIFRRLAARGLQLQSIYSTFDEYFRRIRSHSGGNLKRSLPEGAYCSLSVRAPLRPNGAAQTLQFSEPSPPLDDSSDKVKETLFKLIYTQSGDSVS